MLDVRKLALGKVRQFEVVHEEVEELFAAQDEAEGILGVGPDPGLAASRSASTALARPRDDVALGERLVPRQHVVMDAALTLTEPRLVQTARRNADLAALHDVRDVATLRRLPHRPLHQRLGAPQEALPVLEALAAGIEAPIKDLHRALPKAGSTRLLDPHVPFDQAPDLTVGVAAGTHALDEFAVLLFSLGVLLGPEGDHRQQILDLREHALLDHLANLFVAGPRRALAVVVGARAQRELDDFVA